MSDLGAVLLAPGLWRVTGARTPALILLRGDGYHCYRREALAWNDWYTAPTFEDALNELAEESG